MSGRFEHSAHWPSSRGAHWPSSRGPLALLSAVVVACVLQPPGLLAQPATFFVANVDATDGSIRLVNRSTSGVQSVDPRFDDMAWQPFGLRLHSETDPRSSGGVREIVGSLPRLDVRGEYQIFSFSSPPAAGSGIAFVNSGGVELLVWSDASRYRLVKGGASLGPDGRWLGLVVRGRDDGDDEIVVVELAEGSPQAHVITLPFQIDKVYEESLTLTASFAYVAAREDGDGWIVLSIDLQTAVVDAGASVKQIAGPFDEIRPYMASSRSAVAFLAGADGDLFDVFVARDRQAVLNITRNPGEYVDHRPRDASLAVSDSGDTVTYNLDVGGEPELFVHRVVTPGAAGGDQITSDQYFNPYIDQESFVFLARDTLVFAGGHDAQSTDVFALQGALAEQTINLTRTGSNLTPPFLTTGSLVVHEMFQIGDDRILLAASGYADDPTISLRLYGLLGGELLDEILVSSEAIQIVLAGESFYLLARDAGTQWGLYRVDERSLTPVARSDSDPIRFLLQQQNLAYFAVPGTGLLEVSSDAEPRIILGAELVSSVVSLRSSGDNLLAVLATAEGTEIALVDTASGTIGPSTLVLPEDVLLAASVGNELFTRGDTNGSRDVDIGDAIIVLQYLFVGSVTLRCADAADANDDGLIETADVIYGLTALFLGGPTFPPPFPLPGIDPTDDELGCQPSV